MGLLGVGMGPALSGLQIALQRSVSPDADRRRDGHDAAPAPSRRRGRAGAARRRVYRAGDDPAVATGTGVFLVGLHRHPDRGGGADRATAGGGTVARPAAATWRRRRQRERQRLRNRRRMRRPSVKWWRRATTFGGSLIGERVVAAVDHRLQPRDEDLPVAGIAEPDRGEPRAAGGRAVVASDHRDVAGNAQAGLGERLDRAQRELVVEGVQGGRALREHGRQRAADLARRAHGVHRQDRRPVLGGATLAPRAGARPRSRRTPAPRGRRRRSNGGRARSDGRPRSHRPATGRRRSWRRGRAAPGRSPAGRACRSPAARRRARAGGPHRARRARPAARDRRRARSSCCRLPCLKCTSGV